MALTDNFDSYNIGNLNGQGPWTGQTYFQVHDAPFYSSPYGVTSNTTQQESYWAFISASFDSQTSGVQQFKMRGRPVSTCAINTYILSDTTAIGTVGMYGNTISWTGGTLLVNYQVAAWYWFEFAWSDILGKIKLRWKVDGDAWSAWSAWTNPENSFSSVNGIKLGYDLYSSPIEFLGWDDFVALPALPLLGPFPVHYN